MRDTNKNKTLQIISEIDSCLQQELSDMCIDVDEDRAQISWFIYHTFLKGDYRINVAKKLGKQAIQGIDSKKETLKLNEE